VLSQALEKLLKADVLLMSFEELDEGLENLREA
jgi:hypothetical protein